MQDENTVKCIRIAVVVLMCCFALSHRETLSSENGR